MAAERSYKTDVIPGVSPQQATQKPSARATPLDPMTTTTAQEATL